MGLEQLLPGGLYKAIVNEHSGLQKKSKIFSFDFAYKANAVVYEIMRDITIPGGLYYVLSQDSSSEKKAFELTVIAAHYVALSYVLPLVMRNRMLMPTKSSANKSARLKNIPFVPKKDKKTND